MKTCVAAFFLAFLSLADLTSAGPYKAAPGPRVVDVRDETWTDTRRDRQLPVRVYQPRDIQEPAPVILLSHGLGGSRAAMGIFAQHWASYGYIVVGLQHPGSDDSVWRNARGNRLDAMKKAANGENWDLRCQDVGFAIDELERISKGNGPLGGKIDLSRVGLAGHSFGAQTVQAIIGQRLGTKRLELPSRADARVRAAIAFSPSYAYPNADWAFSLVKTPCLHFTGTKDVSPIRDTTVGQRRVPFDNIKSDGQYLITLNGGDHGIFSGVQGGLEDIRVRRPGRDKKQDDRFHDIIKQATLAFWDSQFGPDPNARQWLNVDCAAMMGADATFESGVGAK